MGEISHDFLGARPLKSYCQQVVVAHGGHGQDAPFSKGLVKNAVANMPAFAGSRLGRGSGDADALGSKAIPYRPGRRPYGTAARGGTRGIRGYSV